MSTNTQKIEMLKARRRTLLDSLKTYDGISDNNARREVISLTAAITALQDKSQDSDH